MADIHYSGGYSSDDDYDYGAGHAVPHGTAEASRVTLLVNWAGAIVSMGLVIGMAIWAWQLLMRDVTDVPVIRALEGSMRTTPLDPGGSVAANQGLAVNRLAEGAEAAPVPDRLVLAPPPVDLADAGPIEQAFANASAPQSARTPVEPVAEPYVEAPVAFDVDVDVAPVADAVPDTDALLARLLEGGQSLDGTALPDMATAPETDTAATLGRVQTIPISIPGVRRSPRPMLRPASLVLQPAVADMPPLTGVVEDNTGFEIAAAELEDGTRLVQLGAFDTADLARAEWQRLTGVFPDFFLGRARVIEEATSGGQTFYRLRAHGFSDLSASRRFCAALVARGAACIPVTVR